MTIFSLLCLPLSLSAAGCGVLDQLINAECLTDAACDDGLFCTGVETCNAGECRDGTPPCPMPDEAAECGVCCDEIGAACIAHACTSDAECSDGDSCNGLEKCLDCSCAAGEPLDCDDGVFCNGIETCDQESGECLPGSPPCPEHPYGPQCPSFCIEELDDCPFVDVCTGDSDCDDGVFCNGVEICDECGTCRPGEPPDCDDGLFCNGEETCDEASGECILGTPPCEHPLGPQCPAPCDEFSDDCPLLSLCTSDTDCDDGLFCTGVETCDECGSCQVGEPLCEPDETCDEAIDACLLPPD